MPTENVSTAIKRVARQSLHFSSLRPGQEEAIKSLVQGRDTLVVQPTGSGKSAIYQIAGMINSGTVVVVSPLIALQQDQLDALEESSAEAAVINSHQSALDNREVLEKAQSGDIDFLFLAPEQFRKKETLSSLRNMEIGLFAVDEAHCISEWGHDFRPDYMMLGDVVDALNHPTVVALTATASADVRDEIVARLHMRDPHVIVSGFDRPNISLEVHEATSEAAKQEALLGRVRWSKLPGIIYCATRQKCEIIQQNLCEAGRQAVVYHAGLKAKERTAIQDNFMSGQADIIVATNAFGMGIDKPNIRFVFHLDIPESLDAYYQQIGRAGRDGEPSEAVLFYRPQDIGVRKFQTGSGGIKMERLQSIANALSKLNGSANIKSIAAETDLSARQVSNTLLKLQEVGAVKVSVKGDVTANHDLFSSRDPASERSQQHKEHLRKKLQLMQCFAEIPGCRRKYLLEYFGDQYDHSCGNCDNCQRKGEHSEAALSAGSSQSVAGGTRREVIAE